MTFFEAFYTYCNYCTPYAGAQKEVYRRLVWETNFPWFADINEVLPEEPYSLEDYAVQSMFNPIDIPPEPLLEILNDKGREMLLHLAQEFQCSDFLARTIRAGNKVPPEQALTL